MQLETKNLWNRSDSTKMRVTLELIHKQQNKGI
uniref:Uncharacterized protein n=1 Tax=Rhizophora mucronata TaxID=61149 RepID=A0A2P2QWA6_RHIMU